MRQSHADVQPNNQFLGVMDEKPDQNELNENGIPLVDMANALPAELPDHGENKRPIERSSTWLDIDALFR